MNRSYHITFWMLILCFTPAWLLAATSASQEQVDMLTYRYYMEKKWDSVIMVGKQALHDDIDFYYLRVRMGLAYYEKTKFIPASAHLKKAREFDATDPVIADYLYYAYLFSNQTEEAQILKASLPRKADADNRSSDGFMNLVNFESGYTFSSNNELKVKPPLMGTDSVYGETDLYGNYLYEHLGLKFNLSKRIGLTVSYSYLNFSKTKYIQYARVEDHLLGPPSDSSWGKYYHYSFPRVTYDTSFQYHINQHELHAGLTWYLNGGFRIMPVVHAIMVSYPVVKASASLVTVTDTGYYLNQTHEYVTFPFTRTIYSYNHSDTSFVNYLAGVAVSKQAGRVNIGLSASYSNINKKKQIEAGASVTWLPFGNLNLYSTTSAWYFSQGNDKRFLWSQLIGGKITSWCWAEGSFYYGDFTNANIMNGSVIYNNSDVIDYRTSANLYFYAGKHLQFSLIYQYARKESKQYFYTLDSSTSEVSSKPSVSLNPYFINTVIAGITWKF